MKKKSTHGGTRLGAGPPKKPESERKTEPIKFMVTKAKKQRLTEKFPKKVIHQMFANWSDEILKENLKNENNILS